ncbi:amidohydrolase [Megasphaera sp.]|uniref:amidohydrolase n=1 Tax=Megasphaera sp. TaxID=2023260 RepID=UPI0025847E29|nr:amidohydrolase [Megasphaera sp.]
MEYKQLKEDACRYVDELKPLIYDIADKLHARPELGQEEFFASALLKDILTDHGFTLDNPVADAFPTAFHGTFGSGPFQMGFLAEYDALPKIGHGCGHNLIAAMSIGAALAFAKAAGEKATVHVYGCPAEETVGSKVYMSEHGVFDDLHAAVIVHPGVDKTYIGGTSYATHPLQFTFLGKAAHVADTEYHGINALDALVDFYGRLKAYEKTLTERHIIGAIITEGGTAPNIVPDRAVLKATIRALTVDYLEHKMLPDIKKMAQDVAAAHQASVEMVHYEPLYKNMVNDPKMDVYFADAFNQLYEEFGLRSDDFAEGSTDVGNVSQVTRVSQPEICIGYGMSGHTPEFAAAAGSDLGKMQALTGAKAMAMVGLDVMGEEH